MGNGALERFKRQLWTEHEVTMQTLLASAEARARDCLDRAQREADVLISYTRALDAVHGAEQPASAEPSTPAHPPISVDWQAPDETQVKPPEFPPEPEAPAVMDESVAAPATTFPPPAPPLRRPEPNTDVDPSTPIPVPVATPPAPSTVEAAPPAPSMVGTAPPALFAAAPAPPAPVAVAATPSASAPGPVEAALVDTETVAAVATPEAVPPAPPAPVVQPRLPSTDGSEPSTGQPPPPGGGSSLPRPGAETANSGPRNTNRSWAPSSIDSPDWRSSRSARC